MFRFFRQIRSGLLSQSRITKYLLYALGEIALVVVGILIALQIDNWNQQKQETEIYKSYLYRLRSDIELIQDVVRQKRNWEEKLIELGQYQLDVLTGKETNPNPLKLAISIEFTGSINRYEIGSPTYKELNSTGRLALIENDSIKNFLSSYDLYILMRKDQKTEWDPWVHQYRSMVRDILHPQDRVYIDFVFGDENANLESQAWKNFQLTTHEKEVYRGLSAIPGVRGLLRDILTSRQITLNYMEGEIEACSLLLELIASELKRLDDTG
jgi:hypothetical protein